MYLTGLKKESLALRKTKALQFFAGLFYFTSFKLV